jgi:dihydroflavonol-4-reductase
MQTLVTGGSGFIGQHLVAALLREGRRVRILDIRPPTCNLEGVQFLKGSVVDRAKVREAVSGVEEVYHLAALPGMWVPDKQDFNAVNCLGTEIVIAAARERGVSRLLHCSTESILFSASNKDGFVAEHISTTLEEMPGAYTRSKLMAEQRALEAAASGFPVVVASPTMPIGNDRSLTPPALMLQYFMKHRIQFYLDFVVNLVDVQDVAEGLMLAMQRGRRGERYVLGGKNISLKKLLATLAIRSGRKTVPIPVPAGPALMIAGAVEFIANHATHRPPTATVEGVRIALWSKPLSIEKSRRELGYSPRPIGPALEYAILSVIEANKRYRGGRYAESDSYLERGVDTK